MHFCKGDMLRYKCSPLPALCLNLSTILSRVLSVAIGSGKLKVHTTQTFKRVVQLQSWNRWEAIYGYLKIEFYPLDNVPENLDVTWLGIYTDTLSVSRTVATAIQCLEWLFRFRWYMAMVVLKYRYSCPCEMSGCIEVSAIFFRELFAFSGAGK